MKRNWQVKILFFVLFAFWGDPGFALDMKGPKMVLKEKVFDYKEVIEGEIIEHSFHIRNKGDQPLKIEKVRPG